jgi:signal transduction histidine kinase
VIGIFVGAEIEIWFVESPHPKLALGLLIPFWTLTMLARHRFPLAPALAFFVLVAESLVMPEVPQDSFASFLVVLVGFVFLGSALDKPRLPAAAAFLLACDLLVELGNPDGFDIGSFVFVALMGFAALGAGYFIGSSTRRASVLERRAAQLEVERAERAREAVTDERRRIARELHDVLAHSVSVMTIQAGAARLLLTGDEPEKAREPLLAIEETGREALGEMRRMLGILRKDMAESDLAPQPGLGDLGTLVERCEKAGLPVELAIEGEPRPLAPGIDLSAYRIVQEALTNTIKYAGPAQAWVTVRYGSDRLELEISHNGGVANGGSGGHGLVGMRERVALYGGELESGKHPLRGWVVRARTSTSTRR